MSNYLQVTTTTDTRERAEQMANTLVERRLAACVQIVGPMRSVYRWQGVESAEEWLCIVKTRRALYDALETAIRELHSYAEPEIIATDITAGSVGYLAWIESETEGA